MVASLPALSHQIKQDRLQRAKLSAWISVLQADISRERKERVRMRGAALQAAGMSLRDPKSPRTTGAALPLNLERKNAEHTVDADDPEARVTSGQGPLGGSHEGEADDASDSPEDVEQPITPQDTPAVQPSVVRSGSTVQRRERAGSLGSRTSKRSSLGRPATHRAASENLLRDEERPFEVEEDRSSDTEEEQGEDAGVKASVPA